MSGSDVARAFENVLAGANELDHGQGKIGEVIGIGGLAAQQEIIQRFGIGLRGKFFPLLAAQLNDAIPALGRTHDAAQRRNLLQQTSDHAVGGNHEVFNQFGGTILLLLHDIDDLIVEHQGLKIRRSAG